MKTAQKTFINLIPLFALTFMLALTLTSCGKKEQAPVPYIPENYLSEGTPISFDRTSLNAVPNNPNPTLNVPTYITKVDGMFFIVDCYNDQVIYHHRLADPLYEWHVMTSDISKGHTLASDGQVYVIDDTENNRLMAFQKTHEGISATAPTTSFTMLPQIPSMPGVPRAGKCIFSAGARTARRSI